MHLNGSHNKMATVFYNPPRGHITAAIRLDLFPPSKRKTALKFKNLYSDQAAYGDNILRRS